MKRLALILVLLAGCGAGAQRWTGTPEYRTAYFVAHQTCDLVDQLPAPDDAVDAGVDAQ